MRLNRIEREELWHALRRNGYELTMFDRLSPPLFVSSGHVSSGALEPEADAHAGPSPDASHWFEQPSDVAGTQGWPIEWRAYYYLDRLFYLCPKDRPTKDLGASVPPSHLPPPPDWLTTFCSVDYVFERHGLCWWEASRSEGEFSPLPEEGNPAVFLKNLAREIDHGYDYPDWAWCVTGNIVQRHRLGERGAEVSGTRHFRAGQKVFVVDGYFGLGAERCTVVGKPKYSDKYVCVDMNTDLIENFSVERVTEDIILRAIYTGRLYEEFVRRDTRITSCWGNDDEDLEDARKFAEHSNRYYRKTQKERPTYRGDGHR